MGTAAITSTLSWWTGAPIQLLRKATLIPESSNHLAVHTLTFSMPHNSVFISPAKHHSELKLALGDVVKLWIPEYKPKSYSLSALRDDEFDVTFKVYPNGRASGYLDRLVVGDHVRSFGMSSGKTRNPGSLVGIIAYGVGITEALPVARAELEQSDAKRVLLLWASRTMADTFWHSDIDALLKSYPADRFQIKYILSREEKEDCLHGRINPTILKQVFGTAEEQVCTTEKDQARFLSVGTKEMMKLTDKMLTEIGYAMPQHALLPKK